MVSAETATVTGVNNPATKATITNRIEFNDNLLMSTPDVPSPCTGAGASEAYSEYLRALEHKQGLPPSI
jgi:hypothetical protein